MLASLDDINGNLDGKVVAADDVNTSLLQVSVGRIVRGYLSRVISNATMASWDTPETTPELVREAAGKLIAAQLYFNAISRTSLELPDRHFAQVLYDQAMEILNRIITGTVELVDTVVDSTEGMSTLDFFPRDDTDRAFSMGQQF